VVLRAGEAATLTVPDDDAYSFVGAAPGETVWVVPQTQNPDVVWVGWNTQDPEVMAVIDRGVTLSLTGVQGPGTMTTYLQSGSFGAPQILWDSRVSDPQPIWVDVNTHTHANWVFTEPGVYLVRIEAAADLLDGTSVADTQVIRFAIGEAASTAEALAAEWDVGDAGEPGGVAAGEAGAGEAGAAGAGEAAAGDAGEANAAGAAPPSDAPSSDTGGTEAPASGTEAWTPILIGVIALVAVGLVVGFGVEVVRGNRAKRRVLAARRADGEGGEGR
jgi:surface-anchored protein